MHGRRLVLALLAAALLSPAMAPSRPTPLEASSLAPSLSLVIDEGAAAILAGATDQGETLARAREVVAGLKEGAPLLLLDAYAASRASAVAAAATSAVARASPATPTDDADRAALRALAKGTMRGALAGDADPALVAALVEGGTRAILAADEPPQQLEALADAFLSSIPAAGSSGSARAAVATFIGDLSWTAPVEDAATAARLLARLPCDRDATTCERVGATLGEALAVVLPRCGSLQAPARADAIDAALQALADAEVDALPIASAILDVAAGDGVHVAEGRELYAAVATQALALVDQVPTQTLGIYAGETARWLLLAPPGQRAASAAAAATRVADLGAEAVDPVLVAREVELALRPEEERAPAIAAGDGTRALREPELDGTARLDGLAEITITLYPSGADDAARYTLRWTAGGAWSTMPMEEAGGAFRATLAPDALAGLPRAAVVSFVIDEERDGETRERSRDGVAFGFVPDRDAPSASMAEPTVAGPSLSLAWRADDGDGAVAGYRVQVREGDAWRDWIASTADTRASFHGEAGETYAFRVIATDTVGHEGAPSAAVVARVPPTAPPNRAPEVAFLAPAPDDAFTASVPVALDAHDPDGASPTLRLCVRRADQEVDLSCLPESRAILATLDASALPDGRYRLHAYATDGTRASEATSGAFTLDRAPPAFRGASVDATPTRVRLAATVEEARAVTLVVEGRTLSLTDDGRGVDARGGDGVWTAGTVLPAGEHVVVFHAVDALGNEATLARTVVVPVALASPEPADEAPPVEPPTPPEPAARVVRVQAGAKETPAFAAWMALAALALLARRRA